jgi:hypothetical protein
MFTPKMARIGYILYLKLTTLLYQASFCTDLTILNPKILIITQFSNMYIVYMCIFSTEISIIFNCDGVVATNHNICTFVVL